MNRKEALRLIDVIVSESSSPVEKKRAEARLRELIAILLPEETNTESYV